MWKIGNLLLRQSSADDERWQDILAKREHDIGSLHMFLRAREQQLKTANETIQSLDHQLLEAGAHIAALEQSIELLKRKAAEAGASVPEKEVRAVYVETYNTKAREFGIPRVIRNRFNKVAVLAIFVICSCTLEVI